MIEERSFVIYFSFSEIQLAKNPLFVKYKIPSYKLTSMKILIKREMRINFRFVKNAGFLSEYGIAKTETNKDAIVILCITKILTHYCSK